MAQVIWKFPLEQTSEQVISVPTGTKMLCVAVQNGVVCLWGQVDPEAKGEKRLVRVFGTGHPMPDDPGEYVGTFLLSAGALVFHVYSEAY